MCLSIGSIKFYIQVTNSNIPVINSLQKALFNSCLSELASTIIIRQMKILSFYIQNTQMTSLISSKVSVFFHSQIEPLAEI